MSLNKMKIAVFLENIFEDTEFWYPFYRMKEANADVVVIAPEKKSYTGKNGTSATADMAIKKAKPEEFDALIIPGGYSPDRMRRSKEMVDFVRSMDKKKKVIAAICHAGWMLASAEIVKGRKLTSFFSIKDDMINAGAKWVDKEVVVNENLVTSRFPDDLPVFCTTIIEQVQKK